MCTRIHPILIPEDSATEQKHVERLQEKKKTDKKTKQNKQTP